MENLQHDAAPDSGRAIEVTLTAPDDPKPRFTAIDTDGSRHELSSETAAHTEWLGLSEAEAATITERLLERAGQEATWAPPGAHVTGSSTSEFGGLEQRKSRVPEKPPHLSRCSEL